MYFKKGVSEIISWVLLLGFAVASATTIFLWMTSQTETLSESTVDYVEGEMQCQNIGLNVRDVSEGACSSFEISNTGYMNIDFVVVREFCKDGGAKSDEPLSISLKPKSSKTEITGDYKTKNPLSGFCSGDSNSCSGCDKVEFLPITMISDKKTGCKERAVAIKCL